MANDKKMGIIIAGLGKVSVEWIGPVVESDNVELVALVDISEEAAKATIQNFKLGDIPYFTSLDEAFANVQAEGLIDLTPPHLRLPNAQKAFDAGLSVLAEKPLSDTLDKAEALVKLVDEAGKVYMIGQNYRYGHIIQTAKKFLDTGKLGQIGSISGWFYKTIDLPGFHASLSDVLLQDMSIHHFDLMRFFLDANPKSIFAHSYNVPYSWHKGNANVSASIQFENDVVVTYQGSWATTGQETQWNGNWRIDCEKGVLTIIDNVITVEYFQGLENHPTDRVLNVLEPKGDHRGKRNYLVQEFYDAVRNGKPAKTVASDNLHSIRMVFDAIESSRTGTMIQRG